MDTHNRISVDTHNRKDTLQTLTLDIKVKSNLNDSLESLISLDRKMDLTPSIRPKSQLDHTPIRPNQLFNPIIVKLDHWQCVGNGLILVEWARVIKTRWDNVDDRDSGDGTRWTQNPPTSKRSMIPSSRLQNDWVGSLETQRSSLSRLSSPVILLDQ